LSTDLDPSTDAPIVAEPTAKKLHLGRWLGGVAIVGAVLGFAGGITSHALFPAHNGKPGAQGPVGQAGPAGPSGPAGSSTDLGTTGYCFNTSYFDNQTYGIDYINSVSLTSPVDVNGTQTCPSGTFVPLQPSTSSS
jgi:hypothetical protein